MSVQGTPNGSDFAAALAGELPRLVHVATRLVQDADLAEDCAQETIVGASRRRDQLRDRASLGLTTRALRRWLRALVRRTLDILSAYLVPVESSRESARR